MKYTTAHLVGWLLSKPKQKIINTGEDVEKL